MVSHKSDFRLCSIAPAHVGHLEEVENGQLMVGRKADRDTKRRLIMDVASQ